MGTKIYYSSGHVVELQEGEGPRFWNRARNAGFRYYQSLDDVVIPFNHPTITHIELQLDDPRSFQAQKEARKVEKEKKEAEVKPADIEQVAKTARAQQEADFMARANCTHKDKEGKTLRSLYYTETVNGRKYFPVCDFCGHRERYVGIPKIESGDNPLWTMEDVRTAKPYEA